MTSVTARAPAKVNLALAVGAARADGFHPLATIYQALSLSDEVRATSTDDGILRVSVTYDGRVPGEAGEVPLDSTNLAVRAAALLQERSGAEAGATLAIRKSIPVAGGLAGGSADAAATLIACDALWSLGTPREELLTMAAELGSDVPFSLLGGTAMGTGRGELVSPVLARGTYCWVLALAGVGLSTPSVYAAYDRRHPQASPDPAVAPALMAALRAADPAALGAALSNDLQDAALSLRPELTDTLRIGEECGALGALVCGSGPTTMFLAGDEEQALDLSLALTGAGVCADVVQATGPAPGARIIG
ncbi:MAG: 4-(cytidine 5'-diphospho)-2-C-methyl-D-erythritol kinase [Nocardioidaceae bacterium]